MKIINMLLLVIVGLVFFVGGLLVGTNNKPEPVPQDITLRVNGRLFHLLWSANQVIQEAPQE